MLVFYVVVESSEMYVACLHYLLLSAYIFSNSGQCCTFLVEYEPQVQGEIQPESMPSVQLESYTEASTSGEQYTEPRGQLESYTEASGEQYTNEPGSNSQLETYTEGPGEHTEASVSGEQYAEPSGQEQYTNGEYYPHIAGYSQNVPQDDGDGLQLGPESHGEELTGNGHVVQGEEAEFCEGQSQGQPQGQGHDADLYQSEGQPQGQGHDADLYQGHDDQFEGENHTEGQGHDPGQGDSDYIPESPHPAVVPEGAIQIPDQVSAEQENGRVALDITAYARAVATASQVTHGEDEMLRGENVAGDNAAIQEVNDSHPLDTEEVEGIENIVGNAAEVQDVMQEFSDTHGDVTTEQGGMHHDTGMESGMESDQYDMAPENAPRDPHTPHIDQHVLQIGTVSSQHESELVLQCALEEPTEGQTQDMGNNCCHFILKLFSLNFDILFILINGTPPSISEFILNCGS